MSDHETHGDAGVGAGAGRPGILETCLPIIGEHTQADGVTDWAAVSNTARDRMVELHTRITADLADFDAFEILANAVAMNAPIVTASHAFVESEHAGNPVRVEYLAALVVEHGSRRKQDTPPQQHPGILGKHVAQWDRSIQTILALRTLQKMADPGSSEADDGLARASYQQFVRELGVRGPSYAWQEERILRALFTHARTATWLDSELGLSVDDAVVGAHVIGQRLAAMMNQSGPELAEEANKLSDILQAINAGKVRHPQLEAMLEAAERAGTSITELVTNFLAWATFTGIGDRTAFTVSDLASEMDVDQPTAQALLDLLAIEMGTRIERDPARAIQQISARPVVSDGSGNYICVDAGDATFALRPQLTEVLKSTSGKGSPWEAFQRHRARWTEDEALRLLGQVLHPDDAATNITYEHDGETCELDGIAVVDDFVLLVEVKAGEFTTQARRARPDRFRRDLNKLVREAHDQAQRAQAAIEAGAKLIAADGRRTLKLPPEPRFLALAVTLDFVGASSTTWQLVRSGFLSDAPLPATMSLTDLEVVCDVLNTPARLLHYLTRRQRMDRLGGLVAHDECDLLMYYLEQGLWANEVAPDRITMLHSLTDPLDAYYYAQHLPWTTADAVPPKPAPRLHPQLATIIAGLEEFRPPGWTATAMLLLELAEDEQDRFGEMIRERRDHPDGDGLGRDLTFGVEPLDQGATIVTGLKPTKDLADRASFLARKNKYATKASRWAAVVLNPTDTEPALAAHADLRADWEPDPEMDQIIARKGS